jgi:PIN domain nuclease of toxin-antitoxin system
VKSYVFDTHAVAWAVRDPRRLGDEAARAVREVEGSRAVGWVPVAAGVELALLREAGRRVIGLDELEATMARAPSFKVLTMDLAQVREFAALGLLRDPFDRMIVAAARSERCPLVTADETIAASGLVRVLWD